jgi:hypothetical protein
MGPRLQLQPSLSPSVVMTTYNTGEDGSFLGLGFSHGGVASTPASSAVETADLLMNHYLQQCLDYHEEQQQHDQKGEAAVVPQFVTAQHPPSPPPVSVTVPDQSPSVLSQPPVSPLSHSSAHEAIAKARSIVLKFTQQHYSGSDISPADYRYRRECMLEKERMRLHAAMLKNFQYVARKEEEHMKVKLAQLQETKVLEQQLQKQHAAMLIERKQASLAITKAGIGTFRRQKVEKSKEREGHAVSNNVDLSIALYLSGLPKNTTENSVRQLFASYGSIRRIHFYRNKETGELKGDGLVVYNAAAGDGQEILDAVCLQVIISCNILQVLLYPLRRVSNQSTDSRVLGSDEWSRIAMR